MKELYKYFKYNGRILDIEKYDADILEVFSRNVFKMIAKGEDGWEGMLPEGVPKIIKDQRLFGYSKRNLQRK